MQKFVLSLLILLIALTDASWGGRIEQRDFSFPADSIQNLILDISLGGCLLDLKAVETSDIFSATVEYDPKRVEVYAEYDRKGAKGYLEAGSENLKKTDINSDDNRWDITLSKIYKTDLSIDIGASDARIDLSGIPLTELSINIGAADGSLVFGLPNPAELDQLDIEAGAAKFHIEKLGNANFQLFTFDGGLGSFKIDFSGQYRTHARADISIGLGKALIYIPSDLPVRIEADETFLSSIEFKNTDRFDIEDGYFESRNFRNSPVGLDIKIEVGFGSAEIIWTD